MTTRGGTVQLAEGVRVLGDVSCTDLELHENAVVDGSIRSRGEMRIVRPKAKRDAE